MAKQSSKTEVVLGAFCIGGEVPKAIKEWGDQAFQETLETLRSEVQGLFNALQFQDIIAQQLQGTADMLAEVEQRLQSVAAVFDDPNAALPGSASESGGPGRTYESGSTIRDSEARPELVDEVLKTAW